MCVRVSVCDYGHERVDVCGCVDMCECVGVCGCVLCEFV